MNNNDHYRVGTPLVVVMINSCELVKSISEKKPFRSCARKK